MPATLTRPKTTTHKKTIDELGKRAQDIISKYDIKPFNRKELYGNCDTN